MAGYTLILAILILGGMIATLGDRIGTKVGKARLSMFNLRPRDTATLVTIATGGMISASTLGILLLMSGQLRDGLFRLESIRSELASSQQQKQKVETELNAAKSEQEKAQQRLEQINKSLVQAVKKQSETQALLQSVESKFQKADEELQKASQQEADLRDRIQNLTKEQESLQTESNQLRDEKLKIASELESISRDRETLKQKVTESEQRLAAIDKQRSELSAEIASLESAREQLIISLEALRKGNVAIFADQILALGVVRPNLSNTELRQAGIQLIRQAEINARELLDFLPDQAPKDPVIKITDAQIEGLLDRIKDGRSYVIRILSAGNFLKRETKIIISADVTLNRQIFAKGDEIASLQFSPNLSPQEIASRIEQLFLLVSFRARREGVLANPLTGKVGNFPPEALNELFKVVSELKSPYEIKAVAKEAIFPASSLTLELVIRQNGVEIARFS
ncbi:DUF3084 domain-containing protein [Pseudanabaena sp. FACHB-1998]|uniref:DUF3084 domain-containing protein n=1 Tax=Pseudanabaena sp. FACHB-1998 TaxID=2692858 RepID=UPI00168097B4|nr:DUF3084 domain-containing protein [Pseudanabaena sp. FACHB-1998]MBD2177376.1 DUF3084 domain-containing protein [Pseudanabaena sp. FACHB-1998]